MKLLGIPAVLAASVAMLSACTLAAPVGKRADTLSSELSSLALSSSYLQLYTTDGGSAWDANEYTARWTSFNEAASKVAGSLSGSPALTGDDNASANGAFQTFSDTHVVTLSQLHDVAASKLNPNDKKSVGGLVKANRDQINIISAYLSNGGQRTNFRLPGSTSEVDAAFESAIEALG